MALKSGGSPAKDKEVKGLSEAIWNEWKMSSRAVSPLWKLMAISHNIVPSNKKIDSLRKARDARVNLYVTRLNSAKQAIGTAKGLKHYLPDKNKSDEKFTRIFLPHFVDWWLKQSGWPQLPKQMLDISEHHRRAYDQLPAIDWDEQKDKEVLTNQELVSLMLGISPYVHQEKYAPLLYAESLEKYEKLADQIYRQTIGGSSNANSKKKEFPKILNRSAWENEIADLDVYQAYVDKSKAFKESPEDFSKLLSELVHAQGRQRIMTGSKSDDNAVYVGGLLLTLLVTLLRKYESLHKGSSVIRESDYSKLLFEGAKKINVSELAKELIRIATTPESIKEETIRQYLGKMNKEAVMLNPNS